MKLLFLSLFCLFSSLCPAQQKEEFKLVKNFYNQHRSMLSNEFKKKFDAETDVFVKDAIKKDFLFFMKKMDSIENVALIAALLKVKNLEDLSKLKNKTIKQENPGEISSIKNEAMDYPDYPGGMDILRQEIAKTFYSEGVNSEIKTVKASVSFIVEKDGSITNVQALGDNFTFNRQAEIALYSIPEKFSPAVMNGNPIRYHFRLPLTMNIE
ncbi:hypothetical protein HNP38_002036 [Chryseobacterium defluvii]|uniref:TonB-like protein n=1 Tax=Chryseobacterium defluvii TaxID=160396 RepID=A0A840KGV6_9FLAO|nr:energy transducer TonB [Chryseobacterium defluvii]MBB4806740.1 hypothetical protein [Chryseobacterium defluvii]